MTFLEHLEELRGRLIICLVSIIFTTIVGGILLAKPTLELLTRPFVITGRIPNRVSPKDCLIVLRVEKDGTLKVVDAEGLKNADPKKRIIKITWPDGKETLWNGQQSGPRFLALTPFAAFLCLIKVAIILGIFFAMPIWLHQAWLFVAPALTTAERRVVRPVLLSGIFLFPLGVAFAYGMLYIVMPFALAYAESISGIRLMPDITKYLSFALNFMLAFGIVFETPLILLMFVRMGVVSTATMRKSRPYAIVIIAVLSAVLTPQDPFSMIAMAIPMLALFEISLWVATVVERKLEAARRKAEEEEG